jgi:hypothetical protein
VRDTVVFPTPPLSAPTNITAGFAISDTPQNAGPRLRSIRLREGQNMAGGKQRYGI